MTAPDLQAVRAAAETLRGTVDRTPLLPARLPGVPSGTHLYLKAENLQRTGSFKIRGALNRIRRLPDEQRRRGVVAASAGNHAQGVALAAAEAGVPATIVMPRHAPLIKVEATRSYGAKVELVGETYEEAYQRARMLVEQQGTTFVHPFDDPLVIAGQGTVALEILEDLPDLDVLLVPVGGGGLISGMAMAAKSLKPSVRVIGVESAGAAAVSRSLAEGRRVALDRADTIADGLAVKSPSDLTYAMIRRYVDQVVVVEEDAVAMTILRLLEGSKLLAEGAGAVAVAAALYGDVDLRGRRVAALISGGNIDINVMARTIERALVQDGRYLRFRTLLRDRPGALLQLAGLVAAQGANIITVGHDRLNPNVPLGQTEVQMVVETRDYGHGEALLAALDEAGYPARREPS